MGLIAAGPRSQLSRYVGYMGTYATSHEDLDRDADVREEARNAARSLAEAVVLLRRGELKQPGAKLRDPRPKGPARSAGHPGQARRSRARSGIVQAKTLDGKGSTRPPLPERLRRGAGLLAEKTGEMRGVGERQIERDLVDRQSGEDELALGLGEHPLADQMPGSDAG
jgi:hypothetical protein